MAAVPPKPSTFQLHKDDVAGKGRVNREYSSIISTFQHLEEISAHIYQCNHSQKLTRDEQITTKVLKILKYIQSQETPPKCPHIKRLLFEYQSLKDLHGEDVSVTADHLVSSRMFYALLQYKESAGTQLHLFQTFFRTLNSPKNFQMILSQDNSVKASKEAKLISQIVKSCLDFSDPDVQELIQHVLTTRSLIKFERSTKAHKMLDHFQKQLQIRGVMINQRDETLECKEQNCICVRIQTFSEVLFQKIIGVIAQPVRTAEKRYTCDGEYFELQLEVKNTTKNAKHYTQVRISSVTPKARFVHQKSNTSSPLTQLKNKKLVY